MAFKILCVVLFTCLIDSLHSASVQRIKRSDHEEATTPASTDIKGSEASKPGLPDMGTFTDVMPQLKQVTFLTNKITQNNQANSLIPDNIKSCVPSGQETTKEPEKSTSDNSDNSGLSSNSGSQDNSKNPSSATSSLQFTKAKETFDKVMSKKEFTNVNLNKIPMVGGKE